MNTTTADDLRRLLQSATTASKTPIKPKESSEYDLAALLSSVDITTPAKGTTGPGFSTTSSFPTNLPIPPSNPSQSHPNPPAIPLNTSTSSIPSSVAASTSAPALSNSLLPMRTDPTKTALPSSSSRSDLSEIDFITVKYGTEISLRGRFGKYMNAIRVTSSENDAPNQSNQQSTRSAHKSVVSYSLGVTGQGIGELLDCLVFVSVDKNGRHRDYSGPVVYGTNVALKSPAAMERLLGISRETGKLGFWRSLVGLGQGEQWTILKASGNNRTLEEPGSRGSNVMLGDLLLLQAISTKTSSGSSGASSLAGSAFNFSDHLLSLYESAEGQYPKLLHKDRVGLSLEVWQVEAFASQPAPAWYQRPYLSGRFILNPSNQRSSGSEAHQFPGHQSYSSDGRGPRSIASLPSSVQSHVLLRELLLAMTGVDGQYITLAAAESQGTVPGRTSQAEYSPLLTDSSLKRLQLLVDDENVERSISGQVAQLLPICEQLAQIREFIRRQSRYEYGLVSHALAAAIKTLMREFDVVISQLEQLLEENNLSLQKMTFLLQPSKPIVRLLAQLCSRVDGCAGGNLLERLHACLLELGDSKGRELYSRLLNKAAIPFLDMLQHWLFRGELIDPYKEFMISENVSYSREALTEDFTSQYWEAHFTLRDKHIPTVLKPFALKALTTGKYLTVIRGCSVEDGSDDISAVLVENQNFAALAASDGVPKPSNADGNPSSEDRIHISQFKLESDCSTKIPKAIDNAYKFSSRALLKLLEDKFELSVHLRSLRRFFLLEHGDFFIQFMDIAEEELRKDVKDVNTQRIQSLLHLAISSSTLATDPKREDVSCSLKLHSLIQHLQQLHRSQGSAYEGMDALAAQGLKGVEALTLEYKVGWPVSLILSKRAITKYQLLSRLLYFSKYVELRILGSWMEHQSTKGLAVRAALGRFYCLRQRMLHFLQNFVYYMTLEVISKRGHELQLGLAEAQDMDEVLNLHEQFLFACLQECLLGSQDLLNILMKIMATCLVFADHVKSFIAESKAGELESLPVQPRDKDTKKEKEASKAAPKPKSRFSSLGGKGGRPSFGDGVIDDPSTANERTRKAKPRSLRKINNDIQTEYILKESAHATFIKNLVLFEQKFDKMVMDFLDKLWKDAHGTHPQLVNLCARLDYNGYYSSTIRGEAAAAAPTQATRGPVF